MECLNYGGLDEQGFSGKIRLKSELEGFYERGFRSSGIACLRFILMAFVCFWNFGFPEPTAIVSAISGFAIPCFFILSGYLILTDDQALRMEKTKRKIKRTSICFGFLLIFYILLNIIACAIQKIPTAVTLKTVFNFVVLNLWPLSVGSNIWFVQAMLYAYIIIYILDKCNLMRFYKVILIVTLIIMLLTGEFAGIIHFDILGYRNIPGNWLTRALPYILLGKLLREKEDRLLRTAAWKNIVLWIVGAVLALGETYLLGKTGFLVYEGHMIGYGIMALAACNLAVSKPIGKETKVTALLVDHDPALSGIIYIFMDPIFYLLVLTLGRGYLGITTAYGGLIAYAISVLLAILLKRSILAEKIFNG